MELRLKLVRRESGEVRAVRVVEHDGSETVVVAVPKPEPQNEQPDEAETSDD